MPFLSADDIAIRKAFRAGYEAGYGQGLYTLRQQLMELQPAGALDEPVFREALNTFERRDEKSRAGAQST